MTKEENRIIEASKPYLQKFIEEMKGFYPFAMMMDKTGEINPLYPEIEETLPDPEYLINLYEKGVYKEYSKKDNIYILSVICVDIFIHTISNTKDNAIEFGFLSPTYQIKYQLIYEIDRNNKVIFKNWNK